jgi:hypothetical protein
MGCQLLATASGLRTVIGLCPADVLKFTSRWAEENSTAGRDRAHVVPLPTFPIPRAGTQSPRQPEKKGSFEKPHFSLTRGLAQVSLIEAYKIGDQPLAVRFPVNTTDKTDVKFRGVLHDPEVLSPFTESLLRGVRGPKRSFQDR